MKQSTEEGAKILSLPEQYPELEKQAAIIHSGAIAMINKASNETKSKAPYKAQAILEILIAKMQECV